VLTLHDSATGETRPLSLREPGRVSLYVCGPTVYDVPHLGHGRHSLVYDLLCRYLRWSGLEVCHVSNITDIDDKVIERAASLGVSEGELAERYEAAWWEAMDRLGVVRPDRVPHATAFVPQMVELVRALVDAGLAYLARDGVYLEVAKVPGYGLLAHQPLDSLRAGARVAASVDKRSPLDFALWKLAKPGEPTWPSPFGDGRPGWHTECVVMSLALLGDGFDLHGAGADLAFPHNENERAQAVALGRAFARHWMHHAFVTAGGEKMSKSLGNFTTLDDALSAADPRALRLLVVRAHYRSPLELSATTLADASQAIGRLDALARRFAGVDLGRDGADPGVLARFRAAMDDDLDTPAALGVVFEAVREAHAAADASRNEESRRKAAAALELASVLGLTPADDVAVDEQARRLAEARDDARRRRDWARADAIRSELAELGWLVEDTPAGSRLVRASAPS